MSSTYSGNATNFPTSITIPSDGDGPGIQAADVNAAFEGLMDRTVGLSSAFTFPVSVTLTDVKLVKFNAGQLTWYACDTNQDDYFIRTTDPYVWPGSSEDLDGSTDKVWDFSFTNTGKITGISIKDVVDSPTIYRYDGSVWTNEPGPAVLSASGGLTDPAIIYDSTAARWCVVGNHGTDVGVWTAAEAGVTNAASFSWGAETKPAGLPTDCLPTLASNGSGVLVMQAFSAANPSNMYTSRSTDGGESWSAVTTTALGFDCFLAGGAARAPVPLWTGTEFVYFAPSDDSQTKIYTSTNGAAMTLAATLTSVGIFVAACIGRLICAASGTGWILISPNGGSNWYYSTRKISSVLSIAASPAQFLIAVDGFAYPSDAIRGPGIATVT